MKKFKFIKLIIISTIFAVLSGNLLNILIEKQRSSNDHTNMIYTQILKVSPATDIELEYMKISLEKSNITLFDVQKNAEEFFYKLSLGIVTGCELDRMGSETLPVEISQDNVNFPVTNIVMYQKNKQVLKDCRKALYSYFDKIEEKVKNSLINIVIADQSDNQLRLFGDLVKLQLIELRDTSNFEENLRSNVILIKKVENQLKKLEAEILSVKKARIRDLNLYEKIYEDVYKKQFVKFHFITKLTYFISFFLFLIIFGLYLYSKQELRVIRKRFLKLLSEI